MKLSYNNNDYYVSWRSTPGFEESLGISATFARSLGITEGDTVTLSCVPDPPYLSAISVTPRNAEDWEIVVGPSGMQYCARYEVVSFLASLVLMEHTLERQGLRIFRIFFLQVKN